MTADTIVAALVAAGITSIPIADVIALAVVLRQERWAEASIDKLMFGVVK